MAANEEFSGHQVEKLLEKLEHLTIAVENQRKVMGIHARAMANHKDDENKTPLFSAIEKEDKNDAMYWLAHGANINVVHKLNRNNSSVLEKETSPLLLAIEKGFTDIVSMMTERDANVNGAQKVYQRNRHNNPYLERENTPLTIAIEKGDLKMISILLERDANVNGVQKVYQSNDYRYSNFPNTHLERENTPLTLAIEKGDPEIASMLIRRGANVNGVQKIYRVNEYNESYLEKEISLLLLTIEKGHTEIITMLIAKKAEIDQSHFKLAITQNKQDILIFLLQCHKIDWHSQQGDDLFKLAISQEKIDIIKLMIDDGAVISKIMGPLKRLSMSAAVEKSIKEHIRQTTDEAATPNAKMIHSGPSSASSSSSNPAHRDGLFSSFSKSSNKRDKQKEQLQLQSLSSSRTDDLFNL